jgi:hypothetical protein
MLTNASAEFESSAINSLPTTAISVTPGSAVNAPSNLVAAGSDGQVTLEWTKDADVNIAGYQVTVDDNPTYSSAVGFVSGNGWTFESNRVKFVATGLTNGTEYAFKVSAFTLRSATRYYSADTLVTAVPFAAPSAPQNVKCSVASNTINSSWSAPASTAGAGAGVGNVKNGPILYRLLIDASYSDASNNPVTNNILTEPGISSTSYDFTSSKLLNGKRYIVTTYAYFVGANGNNYVSESTAPVVVIVNAPPQDVSGLTIVPGNNQNVLSWSIPTDASNYPRFQTNIFSRLNAGAESLLATIDASATTYTATGLLNGGNYTYRVVSEHTVNAQQPAGAVISGMPFGKAILVSATPNTAGSSTYVLTINKNGSNLQDWVAIGALPDGSGNIAIPVKQGTVPVDSIYSGAAGTGFDANQFYSLSLEMGVNVDAVLVIIENGAGFITRTVPTGVTTTFGRLPSV